MSRRSLLSATALAALCSAAAGPVAIGQSAGTPQPAGTGITLPTVTVDAPAAPTPATTQAPVPQLNVQVSPDIQRFNLPQTRESVTRQQIEQTVNIVDPEDAVRNLPSIFVRKRNPGDTQPTVQTRTWGVNSSARSLVFVDDVAISALIANNNTIGAPRWGVLPVEAIAGVDLLYGPFAAQFPGNSEGGVLLFTTRMPDRPLAVFSQTGALQTFNMYRTHGTYGTSETSATVGDRVGRVSFLLTAQRLSSDSQPLYFVTNSRAPAGTTGTIPALSKVGAVANVVGAGGLLHSTQDTLTARVSVDLTDWLKANYTASYWDNQTQSNVQTYLADSRGNRTFGSVAAFSNYTYNLDEQHLMNALSLKTDTHGDWDAEAIYTRYDFVKDIQTNPAGVLGGTSFTRNGYVTRLDGTGWTTQDLKGIWRPTGPGGAHELSFGLHRDEYVLENPTLNTPVWFASPASGNGTLYTSGQGKTETLALWAQDAWKLPYGLRLTIGARLESWQAFDGFNLAGAVAGKQAQERAQAISPKASLAWQFAPSWSAQFNFGRAARFPTVAELYQIVSTGSTYTIPNPNLAPEINNSYELAVVWETANSRVRLSLFEEDVHDTLVQQTNLINNVYTSVWQNVSQTRNRGVELATEVRDWPIRGIDVSNALTFVSSRIVSDPQFVSAAGTTATGKRVPYVPDWRETVQVTYRPTPDLALSVAGRYSGKQYSTLDNTDAVSGVFGAFDTFFVVDTHVHYQVASFLSADAGVNNLFNEKYYLFHPFPGRTYFANLRLLF